MPCIASCFLAGVTGGYASVFLVAAISALIGVLVVLYFGWHVHTRMTAALS